MKNEVYIWKTLDELKKGAPRLMKFRTSRGEEFSLSFSSGSDLDLARQRASLVDRGLIEWREIEQ